MFAYLITELDLRESQKCKCCSPQRVITKICTEKKTYNLEWASRLCNRASNFSTNLEDREMRSIGLTNKELSFNFNFDLKAWGWDRKAVKSLLKTIQMKTKEKNGVPGQWELGGGSITNNYTGILRERKMTLEVTGENRIPLVIFFKTKMQCESHLKTRLNGSKMNH